MPILPYSPVHCNPSPSKIPPEVETLRQRLNAGAFVRCPSCLKWICKRQVGSLAIHVPYDNSGRYGYALCKKCARLVDGDEPTRRALTDRCEAYLTGRE